jgi:Oxidoreductase family, NAD-binding Rossmann fold
VTSAVDSAGRDDTVGAGGPARYVVAGNGWRAGFYLRLAELFPERLQVTAVVTPTVERGTAAERQWGVPSVRTIRDAITGDRPDFVVAAVPWSATPQVIVEAVAADMPVLSETPPAADLPGLQELWSQVGGSGLVQVAEQYPLYPGHAARIQIIKNGVLGKVSNVQVSSTHQYHAIALMRTMLGVGFEDAAVTAHRSEFLLANPISRDGWTMDLTPIPAWNLLSHFDFGVGRTGLYDFTDNQWHNELRTNRILVRGSLGELVTDRVVHVRDELTVLESDLVRRQLGVDMNFEGFDLDHITFEGDVVYRNAWQGGRLADDEIAVASALERMGAWVHDRGPAPYPLAYGCQDHMLALAMDESLAAGATVHTTRQPWAS